MNTFSKALKYATTIFLFTILFGVITIMAIGKDIFEFEKNYSIIFLHFFITPFIAIGFYKKDTTSNPKEALKSLAKSALCIFILTYFVVYFFILSTRKGNFPFLNITSFYNGVLGIIINVFSVLIYYLTNDKTSSKRNLKGIGLPFRTTLSISLIISVVYILLLFVFGARVRQFSWSAIIRPLFIISTGLLASMLMHITIVYIKNRDLSKYKKTALFLLVYVFNLTVIPISIFIIIKGGTPAKIVQNTLITSPFHLMCTLSIHVYFIYLTNKKEKEELKQVGITASLKYQQLKAQLSPHFLFNNISVLTALIEENQSKAIKFSENLSNVYRYFLEQEKQELTLLKDELAFANEYLSLLKVRYENALSINNTIDDNDAYYILPMALQQVFENVIKHNEVSMENPITIEIGINEDHLLITNNKNPKIEEEKNLQTGIENIRNRYSFFTDQKVITEENQLNYTIKLPLLKIED